MKKKTTILLPILLLVLTLSACMYPVQPELDSGRVSVVTTIFPPYDFVRQIGGNAVSTQMLLAPGEEVHAFEPTPQDIIDIGECDLFIYVGGASDEWVRDVLASVKNEDMIVLSLMDCVTVYEEEFVEGMQAVHEEHVHESDTPEYDEHVWTSPKNAEKISAAIRDALSTLDPDNSALYTANLDAYTAQLENLDAEFREIVENGVRGTVIFADRFPARYFAEEYGLRYFAAFPGCSAETEASAATVAFLIDKVNEEKIPVVFEIEFSNGRMAETIREDTGAGILLFHSCHNVTKAEFENGETYLSLMEQNAENLRIALA